MRNHWDRILARAETTQRARVLFDHLQRELIQARRITALSDPEDPHGFLAFRGGAGQVTRYDHTADRMLRFGPPAAPAGLVDQVDSFHVRGYRLDDLRHPAADPNAVRYVEVEARFAEGTDRESGRVWRRGFLLRADQTEADGRPGAARHGPALGPADSRGEDAAG
jgi:hypothetical protein